VIAELVQCSITIIALKLIICVKIINTEHTMIENIVYLNDFIELPYLKPLSIDKIDKILLYIQYIYSLLLYKVYTFQ